MIEKQGKQPLYENILWSRPQRRTGRILLVGGHRDGFAELQRTYAEFDVTSIAEVRLALPNKLSRLISGLIGVSLVPSTPSGSIARDALAELVHLANEADAVCIGPNLSNNSETILTMERLIDETSAAVIIPPHSAEQFLSVMRKWHVKNNLLIFLTHKQLYKLAADVAADTKIPLNPTPESIAEMSQAISTKFAPSIVTYFEDSIIVSVQGKTSLTNNSSDHIVGEMAALWLQESKKYEALTTAAYIIHGAAGGGRTHTL